MIKPYKLSVSKKTLNEIYKKVKNYPWNLIQNVNGWEYGTNYNYLKNINMNEKVCKLVNGHVNAKKYLVTTNNEYYNKLSHASKKTLEYQGGKMTKKEVSKE